MLWHHQPVKRGQRHPGQGCRGGGAEGRTTDCGGKEFRGDIGDLPGREVDSTERGVGGCLMGPKVKDTADKGSNRAGVGMSTAGMAHNFAGIGIFLGREGECCKGGKGELCGVSRGSGEGLVADREGNILEAEGLVGGARSRMGVLAGSEKEEETKSGEVGRGNRQGVGAGVGNNIDLIDYQKGDGFDAHGWRVDPLVAFELLLTAVLDLALGSKAEVFGPHTGHRLAIVWPMAPRAFSTLRERTACPQGAILPVRQRWAKTWRKGIGRPHRRAWDRCPAVQNSCTTEARCCPRIGPVQELCRLGTLAMQCRDQC